MALISVSNQPQPKPGLGRAAHSETSAQAISAPCGCLFNLTAVVVVSFAQGKRFCKVAGGTVADRQLAPFDRPSPDQTKGPPKQTGQDCGGFTLGAVDCSTSNIAKHPR